MTTSTTAHEGTRTAGKAGNDLTPVEIDVLAEIRRLGGTRSDRQIVAAMPQYSNAEVPFALRSLAEAGLIDTEVRLAPGAVYRDHYRRWAVEGVEAERRATLTELERDVINEFGRPNILLRHNGLRDSSEVCDKLEARYDRLEIANCMRRLADEGLLEGFPSYAAKSYRVKGYLP